MQTISVLNRSILKNKFKQIIRKNSFKNNNPHRQHNFTVGIQQETVTIWEQRAPLAPKHVEKLVKKGVRVIVQNSNKRCFKNNEYIQAGAEIVNNLHDANLILGVKRPTELSMENLIPDKTYAFFTHTIKAQAENMYMLDQLLERRIRILDYECLIGNKGERLVAFGNFAGIAGTIDILHGIGMRFLANGFSTPFLKICPTHHYSSIEEAKQSVRRAGYEIALGHMPDDIGPLTFVVTGNGNVSTGAQSVLQCLPIKYIQPDQLKEVSQSGSRKIIYVCVVCAEHYVENKTGKNLDVNEYFKNPENFTSRFADQIAPYTSVLINGIYWDPKSPRLINKNEAKHLLLNDSNKKRKPAENLPKCLVAISDISCDLNGSIEFTEKCTTFDEPFYVYNPFTNDMRPGIQGDGILMCTIDNMPAQLPMESTMYFGDKLMPYLDDLIISDATKPFEQYEACSTVKNAIITSNGFLTPKFQYIEDLRKNISQTSKTSTLKSSDTIGKRVLILGSGYVASPVIDYLLRDKNVHITIVSNLQYELNEVCKGRENIKPQLLNVLQDTDALKSLMDSHDLVISLVPWKFHPQIAKLCIEQKRNLLTASYCTPVLKEMEKDFENAGITAFMEIGLDPGIDHLLSKACFDEVKKQGGTIESYLSYTGGIPAPENSNNPLRYKFSWSPEAALSTVLNGARYLKDGKIHEINPNGDLMKASYPMNVFPGFNLEGYPNRDSLKYVSLYNLEGCKTVIRGTMRYAGFTKVASFLLDLCLLQAENDELLKPGAPKLSWRQLICKRLQLDEKLQGKDLRNAILSKFNGNTENYNCLNELGLLKEDVVNQLNTPLASTSDQLSKLMTYGPNERDLIVMSHEIGIDWKNKGKETRKVSLVAYGNPGQGKSGLAMSRTVGIPVAIAATMMINGDISTKGIVLPLTPEIYKPILKKLKDEGIEAIETSTFAET